MNCKRSEQEEAGCDPGVFTILLRGRHSSCLNSCGCGVRRQASTFCSTDPKARRSCCLELFSQKKKKKKILYFYYFWGQRFQGASLCWLREEPVKTMKTGEARSLLPVVHFLHVVRICTFVPASIDSPVSVPMVHFRINKEFSLI